MKNSLLERISKKSHAIFSHVTKYDSQLLLATKTISDQKILEAAIWNRDIIIGENRLQEAEKKEVLQNFSNKKHFIGKIQKNKIRKIIRFFDVIQTVDSLKHLERIIDISQEENKPIEIFLNINISNDDKKSGMKCAEALEIIKIFNQKNSLFVRITGIFTILKAGLSNQEIRMYYRNMKEFFDIVKKKFLLNSFREISMGMSNDYIIALEEGATIVRLGRTIFGERV